MISAAKRYLEGLVIVMIILVLLQTFLEDFAVVMGFGWDFRRVLIFTGFVFDLFFTLEFLTRLYYALLDGRAKGYIFAERGWIDFLASVPLLAFNSGPALFALILGGGSFAGAGGFLSVLKVVKAIRIARILRLLRIAKIFKQIKNAESPMAQRHIARISTLTISTFVFVVFLYSLLTSLTTLPSAFDQAEERFSSAMETLAMPGFARPEKLQEYARVDASLLIVKEGNQTLYSRYDNRQYRRLFGPGDYFYGSRNKLSFFFDLRAVNILSARDNLLYFAVVVALTLVLLFIYSPHFALTVSDPIHVMRRGMQESSYNLEVKTDGPYRDDDIYRLARLYNETFLPLKHRSRTSESEGVSDLSMDDVRDILGGTGQE
jgi:Ion transport protein